MRIPGYLEEVDPERDQGPRASPVVPVCTSGTSSSTSKFEVFATDQSDDSLIF